MALHNIIKEYNQCYYFPAYEIMMDELRDYRFYKTDLIHPNELAIDYIWNRFTNTFFDKTTLEFYKELNNLFKSIEHKPFNPNSDKHQKFLRETLSKIKTLPDTINLNKEIEQLLKLLK